MNLFPSISEVFGVLDKIYSDGYDFLKETKNTVTANETSFTTVMDGVSLTTTTDVDGNVTFKASIELDDNDRDAKNNVVNILLSKAEAFVKTNNTVRVELTINDKLYTFASVREEYDNVAFVTTNDNGVEGYMCHLTTDENDIKDWFFTESLYTFFNSGCCESCVCDDCEGCSCGLADDVDEYPGEPVDETHVYSDDEMDAYANFMCNVVCGDCKKENCDGCEVVGQGDSNDDVLTIPADVDEKDFANFIKNAKFTKPRYVKHEEMMDNLKNALVQGCYEYEDGCVVVMLEDIVVTNEFMHDVEVGKSILENEVDEFQRFLDDAAKRFGFSSATYEIDAVFPDLIDVRFYLPE